MDNKIKKFVVAGLVCAAACTTALAAPHGGRQGGFGPRHSSPPLKVHHAAPKMHHAAPVTHHGAPKMHHAAPKMHHVAQVHHGRPAHVRHAPPPPRHVSCGFRYPRGHHIGGRHVVIVPPTVLINSYYLVVII